MKYLKIFGLVRDSIREMSGKHAFKMSAALSYYAALSLAPLLLVVLAVAGFVLDKSAMAETIAGEMERVLGSGAGDLLRSFANEPDNEDKTFLASAFGMVMLAFGATGLFVELQDDINILWGVEKHGHSGVMGFLRHRLLSFAMVLSIGFLLLVSFVLNSALSALAKPLTGISGAEAAVAFAVHAIVSLVGYTAFFALLFKYLPDVRVQWSDVIHGAVVTSICFLLGQQAIGAYLGRAAVGSAYGAAGSLVVVLVWVFYSSLIVLFGAEITQQIATRRGHVIAAAGTHPEREPKSATAA